MTETLITGHAEQGEESFDFKIGPWSGGIGLMIRRTGNGTSTETGAGIWPSVEKAKDIAAQVVSRAFGTDCCVVWTSVPN